jgi:hypothetical protein
VATAVAVPVVGVELTLSAEETQALLGLLETMEAPPAFRRKNPSLYDVQTAIKNALA